MQLLCQPGALRNATKGGRSLDAPAGRPVLDFRRAGIRANGSAGMLAIECALEIMDEFNARNVVRDTGSMQAVSIANGGLSAQSGVVSRDKQSTH